MGDKEATDFACNTLPENSVYLDPKTSYILYKSSVNIAGAEVDFSGSELQGCEGGIAAVSDMSCSSSASKVLIMSFSLKEIKETCGILTKLTIADPSKAVMEKVIFADK